MTSPITESQAGLINEVPVGKGTARGTGDGGARDDGNGGRVLNVFSHGFLILWALLIIFPLLWITLSAFKNNA